MYHQMITRGIMIDNMSLDELITEIAYPIYKEVQKRKGYLTSATLAEFTEITYFWMEFEPALEGAKKEVNDD